MRRTRVIPTLLMTDGGLVKTKQFTDPTYVGDPTNAIKIFNEKEIDELVIIDITATIEGREPDYDLIEEFASEAFFPLAYGGGIKTLEQAKRILRIGVEKIVLGDAALRQPALISEIADFAGSSSVVVCLDCKKGTFGKSKTYSYTGLKGIETDAAEMARIIQSFKAGEIILQSVDCDGTRRGYDVDLISRVCKKVDIPVVALGGANSIDDLVKGHSAGASALSAGSFFIFYGKHQAVLITYPSEVELEKRLP